MHLGQVLREFRKAKGLTQAQLGAVVGVSQSEIYKYEKGMRKIPIDLLPKLAHALEVSEADFFARAQHPSRLVTVTSPVLAQILKNLEQLPPAVQQALLHLTDALVQERSRPK